MTKRAVLKQEIIAVAGIFFDTFGFRKATMDDIYYFKSKEEIFQSVVLQESKEFRLAIIKAIYLKKTPHNKLKAYVITRMNIIDSLGNFNTALQDKHLMHIDFVVPLKIYMIMKRYVCSKIS